VQGKLIQQDPNDEPASKLLERIKAEKEQLIKDKKIRKEKSIPEIKAEDIPFEIPDGWIWCRIGDIGNNIPNAIVDGPFGSSINVNKDYISSGVKVVRMVNVKPFSFKPENLKFIRQEKYDQLIRHNILPDDVLLSKVGAGIGETCKVPEDFGYGLLATTGLARFRVGSYVMPDFLVVYLNSVSSDLKINVTKHCSTILKYE
jgi:type I restriction enzyme S subunit